MPKDVILTVVCDTETVFDTLNRTQLLSLDQGCYAFTDVLWFPATSQKVLDSPLVIELLPIEHFLDLLLEDLHFAFPDALADDMPEFLYIQDTNAVIEHLRAAQDFWMFKFLLSIFATLAIGHLFLHTDYVLCHFCIQHQCASVGTPLVLYRKPGTQTVATQLALFNSSSPIFTVCFIIYQPWLKTLDFQLVL